MSIEFIKAPEAIPPIQRVTLVRDYAPTKIFNVFIESGVLRVSEEIRRYGKVMQTLCSVDPLHEALIQDNVRLRKELAFQRYRYAKKCECKVSMERFYKEGEECKRILLDIGGAGRDDTCYKSEATKLKEVKA